MLSIVLIVCVTLYLSLLAFKTLAALLALRQMPTDRNAETPASLSELTIVQPILSGDPQLAEVLASNLQTLPGLRFLWLIDQHDQLAQQIARQLAARFPQACLQIVLCPAPADGINPKAFKLELARPLLQTPLCLVLDDDVSLPAASLQALARHCPQHGIVTALPHYQYGQNLPSQLLAQFVNNNSVMTYLPLLPFTQPVTINGMCYAIRCDFLQQCGGFTPIQHHLTDDLAMAELCQRHGGKLLQLATPVMVQTSLQNWPHYLSQMHRWMVFATLLLQQQTLATTFLISVLQGLHPLLLWCLLILSLFLSKAWLVLLPVLMLRSLAMMLVQKSVSGVSRHHFFLSLLSELLQPLHLLHACWQRRIRWRSRQYRVRRNDLFHAEPN